MAAFSDIFTVTRDETDEIELWSDVESVLEKAVNETVYEWAE